MQTAKWQNSYLCRVQYLDVYRCYGSVATHLVAPKMQLRLCSIPPVINPTHFLLIKFNEMDAL